MAFQDGQRALQQGQTVEGLSGLKRASQSTPDNIEYRQTYFAERERALNDAIARAESFTDAGAFEEARAAYAEAMKIDAGNPRVGRGANRVDTAQRHWKLLDQSSILARQGDVEAAVAKVQQVLSENSTHQAAMVALKHLQRQQADKTGRELGIYPRLKAAYRTPVSLSFNNASLSQVFEALKHASGLNYVFDKDVKTDARVTLAVTAKPVEDIIRLLLATNQLDRRVLDEDTLLVYPNTPAKAAEYKEMVVKTFYLSHADANRMAALVKSLTKARDVLVDEKLNLIVLRDSAEVIRMVEKIVAAQDLPEPEVMLELEVLEISTNRLLEMGVSWPAGATASVTGSTGISGELPWRDLRSLSLRDMVRLNVSDPLIAAQLRSTKGGAQLLANPRVRVRNKQSAKILIGERVPVFTTTATANVGTSESVSYLDVGLKLEIEPSVSLDNEVSMKLALEVSNILSTIKRTSGTEAYRLGTRNTSTTLRVHDGETNILAGLIQRDERRSNTGVPGLNELPLLSKLFGAAQDSDTRTEIVLLVTPRIIRNVEPPGVGIQEFLSGTESSMGAAPIQLGSGGSGTVGTARPNPLPAPPISGSLLASPIPLRPPTSASPDNKPAEQAPAPGGAQRPLPSTTPGLIAPPIIPSSPGGGAGQ